MGCNTATVPASVHFIVACGVYYLNDTVSASCEVFVVLDYYSTRNGKQDRIARKTTIFYACMRESANYV